MRHFTTTDPSHQLAMFDKASYVKAEGPVRPPPQPQVLLSADARATCADNDCLELLIPEAVARPLPRAQEIFR
jgi:hypothetical protein